MNGDRFCHELTDEQRKRLAAAIWAVRRAARRLGDAEARELRGLCFSWEREDEAAALMDAEGELVAMGVPL